MIDAICNVIYNFFSDYHRNIIIIFLTVIITAFVKWLYTRIKKNVSKYSYIWIPDTPVKNTSIDEIKKIQTYPKNPKMIKDKNSKETYLGDYISGYESFEQSVKKLFLTPKYKYDIYSDNYGVSYSLFHAKDQKEFEFMCVKTCEELINNFPDYIVQIFSIKKLRFSSKGIDITIELKGINEYKTITIKEEYEFN